MSSASTLLSGNATVLVIDDDAELCTILEAMLAQRGLKTLTAEGGAKGIALYRQHRSIITAVITDMRMPEIDGGSVIAELRRINPDVRIVAISGFVSGSYPGSSKLVLLAKPLNGAELFAALESVVEA